MSLSAASSSSPLNKSSISDSLLNDEEGEHIIVKCGSVEGKFYFSRLKGVSGNHGNVKCIRVKSNWLTPNEFESKGGKGKSRHWKRSLTHKNKTLLSVMPLFVTDTDTNPGSQSVGAGLSCNVGTPTFLSNPVLAFVKAHRLKGDIGSLKRIVSDRFDLSKLSAALKELWAFCRVDLESFGFLYQARRSVDTVFSDIISAFDKLDLGNSLPDIFCEANDLLLLPCLDLDPVSKQLELNTQAVKALSSTINNLPKDHLTPLLEQVSSRFDSVTAVIDSIELIKSDLTSTVEAVAKDFRSKLSDPPVHNRIPTASRGSPVKPQPDRRSNIIVFGLPESDSLEGTKEQADSLLHFVAGRSVPWADAFRLGRRKTQVTVSMSPRPLLIKLCNVWDKRLVLSSKRKLKDYSVSNVFLREDLSLEARKARALKRQKGATNGSPQPPLLPPNHSRSSSSSSRSMFDNSADSGSGDNSDPK